MTKFSWIGAFSPVVGTMPSKRKSTHVETKRLHTFQKRNRRLFQLVTARVSGWKSCSGSLPFKTSAGKRKTRHRSSKWALSNQRIMCTVIPTVYVFFFSYRRKHREILVKELVFFINLCVFPSSPIFIFCFFLFVTLVPSSSSSSFFSMLSLAVLIFT